ncbi:hypothetical protein DERP_002543 [Dermatophagoides pteronyssinus]|uniref:Alpha-latrotoxin n=1 Tax=Dermatophagoides pteronyssinus TaxID=6956 RepID=A0ABQ8JIS7_DERPT|nr:hypothetical protein DERP_002543 [Dermatophagoides pteronyssinus]
MENHSKNRLDNGNGNKQQQWNEENRRFNLRTRRKKRKISDEQEKEKTSNNGAEVLNKKNNDSVCNGQQQQQLQESSANPERNGEKNSKIIIYYCDEYLAIRNEQNSFFICRAQHNIYQNGRKIRIKWFSNDQDPNIYRPDFDDYIDFECILTNLSVKRERDGVSLPESEKNRALNILRRALDVEKGINSPPDPRKVLSDGMDISIIGKQKIMEHRRRRQRMMKTFEHTTISNDSKQKRSKKAKIEVKNEKLNETSSSPSPPYQHRKIPFRMQQINNSKLLIQAIQTDDYEFLEKLTGQQKNPDLNLYSISKPCSISNRKNAIHLAIEREDLKSLRLLMEIEKNIENNDNFNYQLPNDSIELDHCELIIDRIDYEKCKHCQFPLDKSYVRFGLKQNVKFNFIEKILPFCKNNDNLLEIFDDNIILTGKEKNDQKSLEEEYLINEQLQLYPIHIAAINPDPFIFYHLTNIRPDQIYQNDCQQWKPIHYASVCQTFFNLKHLLNLGVSARQCDWKGNTPLHLATKYNRIQNVNLIIQYESSQCNIIPSLFQTYNRKGLTAFHLACKKGFIEIVRLFIENRIQIDFATSNYSGELTSLMLATKFGHLEIVRLLVEHGATINIYDKKNRSALTYAVINGHSNIVGYFLEIGANPANKDLFGNNLFHYALAYDWHSCFELLLKTNINLKDTNIFGLTPIYAAYWKQHLGFIHYILERNILNVNVPINDTGINLTMLACSMIRPGRTVEHLKMFVEKFKCDLTKTDYEGNNSLHYLLKCEAKYRNSSPTVINEIQNSLNILLRNGCDIYLKNNAEISPINFSLSNQCFQSFSLFFIDHYKTERFLQTLSDNEYLWPILISNALKHLSMITNTSGDLPIEFFIKLSKHLLSSSTTTNESTEQKLLNFFDFIMKFYDEDFLKDILLLHLAAQYAPGRIVKRLIDTFGMQTCQNERNESNQTPLTIALINDNVPAVEAFLSSKINIQDLEIDNHQPCFSYYLQKSSSLNLCSDFLRLGAQPKSIDKLGNTSLHLICKNIERNSFIDSLKLLIDHGVNVNKKNYQGQTALHVAFENNKFSQKLSKMLNILLKSTTQIDLYAIDHMGYNAFNYLFMNNATEDPYELFEQINDCAKFSNLLDYNQMNLLHYAAKIGFARSVNFFLRFLDPNQIDSNNYSPLSLAILNGHHECTMILLRSEKNRILDNLEFILKNNIKINLLCHIAKNDWKDAFVLIEQKAIRQNELNELIQISIKSQCLSYASNLIRSNIHSGEEYNRIFLQLFAKYTGSRLPMQIQNDFLQIFRQNLLSTVFFDLFSLAFQNWNSNLCNHLIQSFGLNNILKKVREKNVDLLPLCFKKLIFEHQDLPKDMIDLIELILRKEEPECRQEINLLSSYPIEENEDSICERYRAFGEHDHRYQNRYSSIKYSPLIIAIIMRSHSTVEWLLSLQSINRQKFLVDVNFIDSYERTPLMHAILINDQKIIDTLLDVQTKSPCIQLNLLKRDANQSTIFHHLISPFRSGNYYRSDRIYSKLWNMLAKLEKTSELIDELYRFAIEKKSTQLINWMEKTLNIGSQHKSLSRSIINNLRKDENCVESNHFDHSNSIIIKQSPPLSNGDLQSTITNAIDQDYRLKRIIKDQTSKIPFDVIFTKLDYQNNDDYVYNFYKIQLLSIEESIENFKKIFHKKSGEHWNQVNDVYNEKLLPNYQQQQQQLFTDDDFKKLVLKYIKIFYRQIENDPNEQKSLRNLTTKSIDRCLFILNRLSKLIAFNNLNRSDRNCKKDPKLLLLNDMIDLSEQFYSEIKIYGLQYDQLKPILTMDMIKQIIHLVMKLKSSISSIESLSNASGISMEKLFRWHCKILTNKEELDLIFSYLLNGCPQQQQRNDRRLKDLKIFKFSNSIEWNTMEKSPKTYLLWCHLKNYEFLNFFFNGFDGQTCLLHSDLPIMLNGVCLTNRIVDDNNIEQNDDFWILCETLIENPIEIDDINVFTQENYETFIRDKDCLILSNDQKKNNRDDHYLLWKGFIVPINFETGSSTTTTRFLYLSPKQLRPRYLLNFNIKTL